MQSSRLKERILRHPWAWAVYLLIDNLDHHHAPTVAGAIAFDAFLSLVPLAALAGYILGYLHETGGILLTPFIKAAPRPVRPLVADALSRLADTSAALAPVSIIAFLWVSSAGLSTAMYVFETMFHSPPRPWWWRRLIAIASVLGAVAAVAIITTTSIMLGTALGSIGATIIATVVPPISLVGMLCAFFRIAIRGPRPLRRRLLPGAMTTLVLWGLSSALFSFYVSTLSRYTTLYGGLAAVAIFLFWLWLLALAMLVGGEVNAQLEGVRSDMPPSMRPPPSLEQHLINIKVPPPSAALREEEPPKPKAPEPKPREAKDPQETTLKSPGT